jgi:hypothetical protein
MIKGANILYENKGERCIIGNVKLVNIRAKSSGIFVI